MKATADRKELAAAARRAVALACDVCRAVQARLDEVRAISKDDKSPVTVADFASQAVVARTLREAIGDFWLVGEEASEALRAADHHAHREAALSAVQLVWDATESQMLDAIDIGAREQEPGALDSFWTLDPIDGTKGFLRGEQYAVSLAYIERGRPIVAALGCPNLSIDLGHPFDVPDKRGSLYIAVEGEGVRFGHATEGDDPLAKLKRPERAPGMPIRSCESVEKAHTNQSASGRILEKAGGAGEPARLDSQCKYAVVARGQADAYLRLPTKKGYVERIWDHAAGALVASEAGAVVTDIYGKPLDFGRGAGLTENPGVVCAPAEVHRRLIAAIADLGIGPPA